MKNLFFLLITIALYSCQPHQNQSQEISSEGPISLHPVNPHYFLYKGQPLVLITSAEHYGAVLNLDFDYKKYLETLSRDGMNYTRIFTGTYFEISGESFGIQNNTLAPQPGRVITPWVEVSVTDTEPIKYDLSKWNESYFNRLNDFMNKAASLDIIVEVTLFSSIYRDGHWDISPQNPENNININHEVNRKDAQTMKNGALFGYQEALVQKMVNELNVYDNLFFEIQNEPWSDHPVPAYNIVNKEDLRNNDWTYKADFADQDAMAWQGKLANTITDVESKLSNKHLIAQNYTNFKAPIPSVSGNISIINFHYAWPEAVEWNFHYDKVIGFDESGFAGSDDQVYRRQAWQFILSGGALFNSLDYSFFVGNEDGLGVNTAPGGGSKTLRKQLKVLSDFIHSFELEKLKPNYVAVLSSPGIIPHIMSDHNNAFALFLRAVATEKTSLKLRTDDATYIVQILNTVTGTQSESREVEAVDGVLSLDLDIPDGELALRIVKK